MPIFYPQVTHRISGNTAGATAFISSGTAILAGGSNITLSQAGNAVTIHGATTAAANSLNVSAGTTSNNLTNLVFDDANGVSFGLNGSTVTATVATNYMASNRGSDFVQATATIAGTSISGTIASNVISLSVGPYLTTAMASNRGSDFVQATATIAGTSISGTVASNGLSLSVGPYITTARASTDAVGLNTAQTNVTWTVNSSGISLNAGGYAGTGFTTATTAGTNVVGTHNTAGLSMGIPAMLTTAMASDRGTDFVQATATVAGTNISGTIASNAISLSVGAAAGVTLSTFNYPVAPIMSAISVIDVASATVFNVPAFLHISGTRFDIGASVSLNTINNNSSGGLNFSYTAVCLTKNDQTLNSVSSTTISYGITWSSNNTSNQQGVYFLSIPFNLNMTPGQYWFAVQVSTAATGGTLTGAATTSLGNTVSAMGVLAGGNLAASFRQIGGATAASLGWISGNGLVSSTGNLTALSVSNISQGGANFQRAAIACRILA